MNAVNQNMRKLLNNRFLVSGTILVAVMAYGFILINSALGIDDARFDMYFREGTGIAMERWTNVLIDLFTGVFDYRPVVHELLGIIGLFACGLLMGGMFMTESGGGGQTCCLRRIYRRTLKLSAAV